MEATMLRGEVIVGVDTHKDFNMAVALDGQGQFLGVASVATTPAGHSSLLTWASQFGLVAKVGIEGTGSFGAGLCRFLRSAGVVVLEVERPLRRGRRTAGKNDTLDAENAARAVLAGAARVQPKGGDGPVESLRVLWSTRRGAVKARTQAANYLHSLVVTAPDDLRGQLRALTSDGLAVRASRWRARAVDNPAAASKVALRSVARRYLDLGMEISALDREIRRLVNAVAPDLVALRGVGYETATALLVAAGDNRDRLRSESSFAHLCAQRLSRRARGEPFVTDLTEGATVRPIARFS